MEGAFPVAFGRYSLLERIAVGGMAELFLARVDDPNRPSESVVIKRILPNLAAHGSFVNMFINEAKLTAQLNHPKIVQTFEMGSVDDELFMAMEYVDGVDLLKVLRTQAEEAELLITPAIALHVVCEVLDALEYAHNACDRNGQPLGVVHRDISPANILLSQRGEAKVTDFGIARALTGDQLTQVGTLKGKYGYMSPEQILQEPVDRRSDVFSVGVLLAELLMGRRLFFAESDIDVLLMVRDVRLTRLEQYGRHIEPQLLALVQHALARNPADRFQRAHDFRAALQGWARATDNTATAQEIAGLVARVLHHVDDSEPRGDDETLATFLHPEDRAHSDEDDEDSLDTLDDVEYDTQIGSADGVVPGRALEVREGELADTPPIELLYQLVVQQTDGLLIVEREGRRKEMYLSRGVPHYVASNDPAERLGQYLHSTGRLSDAQLAEAIDRMPEHGHRIGDTLVALDLMSPLEVIRHLHAQVRNKLLDLCSWPSGHYWWYEGSDNPHPTIQLHLDAYEILGAGAYRVPPEALSIWLAAHGSQRPVATIAARSALDAFCLGEGLHDLADQLDGSQTLTEIRAQLMTGRDGRRRVQEVFLLAHTGRIRWQD